MFLDDDVVLPRDGIAKLLKDLQQHPHTGALAIRYLSKPDKNHRGSDSHVSMGATLFRLSALRSIRFRFDEGKCECQCCCDDLRSLGFTISYHPSLSAKHLGIERRGPKPADTLDQNKTQGGVVLAAFDRRDWRKFRDRFVGSLRRSDNQERIIAFAYGLRPSEIRILSVLPRVEIVSRPNSSVAVPIRRLKDFQSATRDLSPSTPVAYWDSGDVLFQQRLTPLWQLVEQHPHKLLVVCEDYGHPENTAVHEWTHTITDAVARTKAFEIMSQNPFINSGFAAGTAASMLNYLQEGHRLRHSHLLKGTRDWGDQTAMNLYCYLQEGRHRLIDEQWNYCLTGRDKQQYFVSGGTICDRSNSRPIAVVHGNAKRLERFWFVREGT